MSTRFWASAFWPFSIRIFRAGPPIWAWRDSSVWMLEMNISSFVLDAYQVTERVASNEFAKRLGLRYFIYSGGLIETSRPFCRKRNNKVFTTEEAERDWPKDSTLPRTKAEKEAGGPPDDYSPLEDCGRWNCRHRIMYIDEQAAFVLRPDLKPKR